jgi:cytochrome c biogenesis protein CcdA/glutaredoxin
MAAVLLSAAVSGRGLRAEPAAGSPPAEKARCVTLRIFVRPDCVPCDDARKFLIEQCRDRPVLRIVEHDVLADIDARGQMWELFRKHKIERPGLPAFALGDQLLVGYRDRQTSGVRLRELTSCDVFVREGCPRCVRAKAFLVNLRRRYPELPIIERDVVKDAVALQEFEDCCRRHQIQAPGLPAFSVFGRFLVGYSDDDATGEQVENIVRGVLRECPKSEAPSKSPTLRDTSERLPTPTEIKLGNSTALPVGMHRPGLLSALVMFGVPPKDAAPPRTESDGLVPIDDLPPPMDEMQSVPLPPITDESTSSAPANSQEMRVPLFGRLRVGDWGMPAFTFLIGLIDGFNPCAMWVLVFLLSVLVNIQNRWKMLAIAGTFVAISGLAYFAFMAAWFNVFRLIGLARPAQIMLGSVAVLIGGVHVKDFFAFHRGITLSIPEAAKPRIYDKVRRIVAAENLWTALVAAIVLALLVNTVELLCTAGLPALYTQILNLQQRPWWQNYMFLGLYNVAYMLDDTLLLAVVVTTLSRRRLQEREGRWLKLLSGVVILILGLLMLLKPEWLA